MGIHLHMPVNNSQACSGKAAYLVALLDQLGMTLLGKPFCTHLIIVDLSNQELPGGCVMGSEED